MGHTVFSKSGWIYQLQKSLAEKRSFVYHHLRSASLD